MMTVERVRIQLGFETMRHSVMDMERSPAGSVRARRRSRVLARCSCGCAALIMSFACWAVPAWATSPCEVQEVPHGKTGVNALRLQGDFAPGIPGQIKSLLGAQYGDFWFGDEGQVASVGLTQGPITVTGATEEVDAILEREVNPSELAFVKASTEVLAVPYSLAELEATLHAVYGELQKVLPAGSFMIGPTIGEGAGADSAGYWPQVSVMLTASASEAQCLQVLPILKPYGTKVSLMRTDEGPAIVDVGQPQHQSPPVPPAIAPPSVNPATLGLSGRRVGALLHLHLTLSAPAAGTVRVTVRIERGRRTLRTLVRSLKTSATDVPALLTLRLPRRSLRSARTLRVSAVFQPATGEHAITANTLTIGLPGPTRLH